MSGSAYTRALLDALRAIYLRSPVRNLVSSGSKVRLRRVWVDAARRIGYPISSPRLPRPPLDRNRKRFRLGRVLLACDLNRDYLDFWPSTRTAWKEIVGLDVTLVLVAPPEAVPAELQDDPDVIPFEPVEGVHPTLQAQCIRLLYPALLETDGAVIISDIDLYPLRASYFHDPVRLLDERFFVVYRDDRLDRGEIDMMFNAARPDTWGEVFDVATVTDLRDRLAAWSDGMQYDGRRGWDGWYTDQRMLYQKLLSWSARDERLWMLDDQACRYNRLNRDKLVNEDGLEEWRADGLQRLAYSDFNCFVPYRDHREINDRILELGLEIGRRGPRRRSGLDRDREALLPRV
jgi:hypothetical protein